MKLREECKIFADYPEAFADSEQTQELVKLALLPATMIGWLRAAPMFRHLAATLPH
jgi:hypothetical protein